ncbi:MAG: hypothetical protein VXU50_06525 [Verrucomicrobiota bacterium]|nr:hypothetical protein [Verrucomicrobiota bacterium]
MLSKRRMLKEGEGSLSHGDIFSCSWAKQVLVDAVGGVERSWWWINVQRWVRGRGRGATWR